MADRRPRESDRSPLRAQITRLEAENERLNKVVRVLMDRAEAMASSVPASDYGLFQTTIMLQHQVRLQTEETRAALSDEWAGSGLPESAGRDMQELRRTAALQIQLLELVVQQRDLGELIDRVATILDVAIILFDARGQVLHRSPGAEHPALEHRLWRLYSGTRGARDAPEVIKDGSDWVFFRDVTTMDRAERVLAAVGAGHRRTGFTDASLSFLQQLTILDALQHRGALSRNRRERATLLHAALTADGPSSDLDGRLQQYGFEDEGAWRVIVLEPGSTRRTASASTSRADLRQMIAGFQRTADAVLTGSRLAFLSLPAESFAVALVGSPPSASERIGELVTELLAAFERTALGHDIAIGCSAAFSSAAGGRRALQQALVACVAARHDQGARSVSFDDVRGHLRLLAGLDPPDLVEMVRQTFSPLCDYDARHRTRLYDTLRVLFAHHLAVLETAEELHVHRNTLQRRLAHVEQLLGIDLSDPDDIVDVRLGFHAEELLGKRLG